MAGTIEQGIEWLEWFIEATEGNKVADGYDITLLGPMGQNQGHLDEAALEGLKDCLAAARVIDYLAARVVDYLKLPAKLPEDLLVHVEKNYPTIAGEWRAVALVKAYNLGGADLFKDRFWELNQQSPVRWPQYDLYMRLASDVKNNLIGKS